jgi:hypothetical protein
MSRNNHHDVLIEQRELFGAPAWRVGGTYTGDARGPRFHKAELACVPMSLPHEYASVALFEQPQPAPVVVSPTQRYEILSGLVARLKQQVPGIEFIGVRLYGSDFDVQLTPELLAPDVLVTHAPLQLVPTLLRAGRRNVAVIEQDLRADGLEQGRNELAVWLVAPTDPAVDAFLRFVEHDALLQGLAGLSFNPVAEVAA